MELYSRTDEKDSSFGEFKNKHIRGASISGIARVVQGKLMVLLKGHPRDETGKCEYR
jgi:hypothetical protein